MGVMPSPADENYGLAQLVKILAPAMRVGQDMSPVDPRLGGRMFGGPGGTSPAMPEALHPLLAGGAIQEGLARRSPVPGDPGNVDFNAPAFTPPTPPPAPRTDLERFDLPILQRMLEEVATDADRFNLKAGRRPESPQAVGIYDAIIRKQHGPMGGDRGTEGMRDASPLGSGPAMPSATATMSLPPRPGPQPAGPLSTMPNQMPPVSETPPSTSILGMIREALPSSQPSTVTPPHVMLQRLFGMGSPPAGAQSPLPAGMPPDAVPPLGMPMGPAGMPPDAVSTGPPIGPAGMPPDAVLPPVMRPRPAPGAAPTAAGGPQGLPPLPPPQDVAVSPMDRRTLIERMAAPSIEPEPVTPAPVSPTAAATASPPPERASRRGAIDPLTLGAAIMTAGSRPGAKAMGAIGEGLLTERQLTRQDRRDDSTERRLDVAEDRARRLEDRERERLGLDRRRVDVAERQGMSQQDIERRRVDIGAQQVQETREDRKREAELTRQHQLFRDEKEREYRAEIEKARRGDTQAKLRIEELENQRREDAEALEHRRRRMEKIETIGPATPEQSRTVEDEILQAMPRSHYARAIRVQRQSERTDAAIKQIEASPLAPDEKKRRIDGLRENMRRYTGQ